MIRIGKSLRIHVWKSDVTGQCRATLPLASIEGEGPDEDTALQSLIGNLAQTIVELRMVANRRALRKQ